MKLTQGSVNSRKVKSRRGLLLLSGTPCIRCLSFGLPLFQANHPPAWPPLPRRSAATDHRRSPALLVGEVVRSPAAANNHLSRRTLRLFFIRSGLTFSSTMRKQSGYC